MHLFSAYDHGDFLAPATLTYMTGVWKVMFHSSMDLAHRPDLLVADHDHEYQRYDSMNTPMAQLRVRVQKPIPGSVQP
jgi:hypothetical protein